MIRGSLLSAFIFGLLGALACGGGGTQKRQDYGPFDAGGDEVLSVEEGEEEVLVEAGLEDVRPSTEDAGGEEPASVSDDGGQPEDFGGGAEEFTEDSGEVEVITPECPCDESIVSFVCGIDGKDYVNDQCAKCAICKDNPVNCIGCTGEKACDPTDPLGPNGWIKQKEKCEVCVCDDKAECERLNLAFPCGPFCDNDGKTWATPCEMKIGYGCYADYDENIAYLGACKEPLCEGCEDQPEDLVCGDDGKTYANYCSLVKCPSKPGVKLAYAGHCLDAGFCPQCAALPKEPVCGTDGVTYANECAAVQCMGKKVDHPGRCCTAECQSEPVMEVCGADFHTYPNDCVLICLGIEKAYDGPCTCPCNMQGPQVCGSDGKTYPNQCWLDCLGVPKAYDGPCQGECPQCPRVFEPVCATDGTTHQNACWLECKGKTLKSLGICQNCKDLCGDVPQQPWPQAVCGPDGVTYPSLCFATKCLGYEESKVTQGPCP